jgi:hypothetical protein
VFWYNALTHTVCHEKGAFDLIANEIACVYEHRELIIEPTLCIPGLG